MEPIKFLINENILNKMKKFYDSQMVPFESENLLLKAHAIGCDIEVTSNYEASFLGQNAVHEAKHWSRSLAKKIEQEKNSDHLCMHPHIGAAETGSAEPRHGRAGRCAAHRSARRPPAGGGSGRGRP